MKKVLGLVLTGIMLASVLTACGGNTGTTNEETTKAQTETTADAKEAAESGDIFSFTAKDIKMELKQDAAAILEALGEPKSYTESESCAFDGIDKEYVFSSFVITTYPDGDTDRINSITLMDDVYATDEGITIGDSKEKVEEAYGADAFNGVNAYIITKGESTLNVILKDDKVSSILYTADFE